VSQVQDAFGSWEKAFRRRHPFFVRKMRRLAWAAVPGVRCRLMLVDPYGGFYLVIWPSDEPEPPRSL
jgi:hypothetical protein